MITKIYIYGEAMAAIEREAAAYGKNETGGVLIGFIADPGPEDDQAPVVIVTHATGGGPKALRLSHRFARDVEYCQEQLNMLYARSGGLLDYVGEWHRHPNACSDLSPTDREALEVVAKAPSYCIDTPVSLIVALPNHLAPDDRHLAFHVYQNGEITELEADVIPGYFESPVMREEREEDEIAELLTEGRPL